MPHVQRLVGVSSAIRTVLDDVDCAARTDAKVLITGESGVGKEVVAGLIHHEGRRVRGPFITINCAGIPDSLLASELFGHVRGSFTDASSDKPGWLEQAHGGTIFMDEVGEMSLSMQALLLRFLENGEIQRVGADKPQMRADVRVITATNRRLMERIEAREFRDDLFYRLNVFHIDIPPLRERPEDVPVLIEYFLRQFSAQHNQPQPAIDPVALARLSGYAWPGNVRELRNVVERFIVRQRGATVTPASLPVEVRGAVSSSSTAQVPVPSRADQLFERIVVRRESFWNVVARPFLEHDLTRDDVRAVVARGLEMTGGDHKALMPALHLQKDDYKKFVNFLRKYRMDLPSPVLRPVRAALSDTTAVQRASGQ